MVYRSQGERDISAKPWRVSSFDKRAVKMKRAVSKIGRGLLKAIIFIIDLLGDVLACIYPHFFIGALIAAFIVLVYYVDKDENKKMQEAPCSEFLNKPMEKAPLRCIKEYSK